jgi:general secretion pathway protein H
MTSPADRHGDRSQGQAGFTLIELLVVLVILGLVLSMVVSKGPMFSRSLTLRQAAGELADGLRETRSYAIGTDRSASFTLDPKTKTFQIPGRAAQRLPGIFTVTIMTTTGEMRRDRAPGIRFDPDGSSTGGRIELGDDKHKVQVGVDWLNGRVKVVNVP